MAAIEINLAPTTKQLRQFGYFASLAIPLLTWFWSGAPMTESWSETIVMRVIGAAVIGAALATAAWWRPETLKWIFVGLSVVTFPIGFVVGEVILLTIFVVAFVPLALLFKIVKRDALQRSFDREASSYWQPKRAPRNAASYYRQS